ncbi:MAG: hypothetical protein U0N43_06135 [Mediterraneibacter sp.]
MRIFRLDTVAYFPLLRGRHSFDAVARIRDTPQLLMDVYRGEERMYLHPLKVWNRYSTRMFLPHSCPLGPPEDCSFETVDGGAAMSSRTDAEQHGRPPPVLAACYGCARYRRK